MALLELSGVSLSFSGLRALSAISFDVDDGQIVGLIGPNGAGKSTLLNCVSRLYRPESGTIRFNGLDLVARKSHEVAAMGIRRTFQNLELFREASVRENVTLGLVYRHRSNTMSEFLCLPAVARDAPRGGRRSQRDPRKLRAWRSRRCAGLGAVLRPAEIGGDGSRTRRPPEAACCSTSRPPV